MKKLALILLIVPFVSNAQETARKVRFGMKIAPAFCWMKPDFKISTGSSNFRAENDGAKVGFIWGPTLEFILNETFLISTGVDINSIGGKLAGDAVRDGKIYNWRHAYNSTFIELPFMIKGRTKEIGHMRYFMHFGLSAGFRYKEAFELTETIDGKEISEKFTEPQTVYTPFKGSMLVGGGAEYNLSGNTSLVGSITFNNGLTDYVKASVFKDRAQPGDDFKSVESSSILNFIALNIGILF